jgi:hypothetical protein
MEDALKLFNDNRDIFVTLGIRKDFNIPKLHSLLHYAESIRIFGTTDNYNTEMFERLHIDFAKEGWRASNRRDEFPQMTKWIDRREKVAAFSHYLESRKELLRPCMDHKDGGKAANFAGQPIHIAKYPHAPSCSISSIQSNHRCPSFTHQLKLYLNQFANTKLPERQVLLMELPMDKLDVYHMFKFLPTSLDDGVGEANEGDSQTIKAMPSKNGKPARFDTAVIMHNNDAEATGLSGTDIYATSIIPVTHYHAGTKIGRVRVIFRLPKVALHKKSVPWSTEPLAYVEWYTPQQLTDHSHKMYLIKKTEVRADGLIKGSILPLANIRQTCQLLPKFGLPNVDENWRTDNVLDLCHSFLINNWAGTYAYQTIW